MSSTLRPVTLAKGALASTAVHRLLEQVAAAESVQADELAAREQVAVGGQRRRKQRPPPQGEMSHISRRAVGATIASRMLAKLPTISLRPVSR